MRGFYFVLLCSYILTFQLYFVVKQGEYLFFFVVMRKNLLFMVSPLCREIRRSFF